MTARKTEFFGLTVKDILYAAFIVGSLLYSSSQNADSTADQLKLSTALLEVKITTMEKNITEKIADVTALAKTLQGQITDLQKEISAVREDVGVLQQSKVDKK